MIDKPVKVPQAKITSVDVAKFSGGLFTLGDEIAPKDSITRSKDIEINSRGYIEPRRILRSFLPDTVETTYQKYPVIWEDTIYYFTLDDGEAKFCEQGDATWTSCDGADNSFTTDNGGRPTFLRVLNKLLIINGKNGDHLAYIDLEGADFPVTKYVQVDDPTNAPTMATGGGLGAGSIPVYYAISFNGPIGETEVSPIDDIAVNNQRSFWSSLGTPGFVTVTRNNTPPTGAQTWNLYISLAAPTGTIQPEDMLQLASGLDLAQLTFIDNGTLAINLSQLAPIENSTLGPKVEHGIIADGRPVLYGDQDNPYNIWIGGGGIYALDFSVNNGGYRSEPEKGTNYYPSAIIGFRTGQGQPALTVLYSNVEGLSKQAVLQQQTVNYGDISFSVWGVVEQHYGAAGVAAPYSAINYNGKLAFLSTDGFMNMETEATMQNVLSINSISEPIDDYVRSIKSSAMDKVVGAGWNGKYMWLVPNGGFDTPKQLLILDSKNDGIDNRGAWYALNIEGDWIGVITPRDSEAFVYISQGNQTFVLDHSVVTHDIFKGVYTAFSTEAYGPMLGISGEAHNTWQANVQVMFYIMNLIGEVEIGVRYRNQSGSLKSISKTVVGSPFVPSSAGGWGDPAYTYSAFPVIPGYIYGVAITDDTSSNYSLSFRRVPITIDDVINEAQWYISSGIGYNGYMLRSVSFEGINLGVLPDLA